MKLRAKNLRWLAGRPVVILSEKSAKKLNIHVNDRISLMFNRKKIYAVVDLYSNVKEDEIGLSEEIISFLKNKSGDSIDIGTAEMIRGAELIRKKMSGQELSEEEIKLLVSEITSNDLTEPEIAYFVSAEKIKGMSMKEIFYLTEAMISTGKKLSFKSKIVADKHCIGGIAGNRTTPIAVSICAAAGLTIPKSSSRAITSASGTADVIETLTNVELSAEEIKKVVEKTGACLVWGGSLGLAPSDDKIIRIERILNIDAEPQLIASILSKKIAAGSNHIIIDIPYGGGKMKTISQAKSLGEKFESVAKHFKIKVKPVYTDGKQPIGNGFGPVLEIKDVLSVLKNEMDCPQDLKEKSIFLATELMEICGIPSAKSKAREILESGKAYEKFKDIINAQNKKDVIDKKVSALKLGKFKKDIIAMKSGKIKEISNEKINSLCRILGNPETISAGAYLHKHLGNVKKGEKLLTLYAENKDKILDAERFLKESNPILIS